MDGGSGRPWPVTPLSGVMHSYDAGDMATNNGEDLDD